MANRPGITPGSYWNPAGLAGEPCFADGQAAQFGWATRPGRPRPGDRPGWVNRSGGGSSLGKPAQAAPRPGHRPELATRSRRNSCLDNPPRPRLDRGHRPGWSAVQVTAQAWGPSRLKATRPGGIAIPWAVSPGLTWRLGWKLGAGLSGLPSRAAHPPLARVRAARRVLAKARGRRADVLLLSAAPAARFAAAAWKACGRRVVLRSPQVAGRVAGASR